MAFSFPHSSSDVSVLRAQGKMLVDRLGIHGYTVINLRLSTTRLMLLVTRALAFASVGMLAEIFCFVYLMTPVYFIQFRTFALAMWAVLSLFLSAYICSLRCHGKLRVDILACIGYIDIGR